MSNTVFTDVSALNPVGTGTPGDKVVADRAGQTGSARPGVFNAAELGRPFLYAHNPSVAKDSLSDYQTPVVGAVYTTGYSTSVRQHNSGCNMRCVSGPLASPPANTPIPGSYVRMSGGAQTGILFYGYNGATYHVLFEGGINLESVGIITDGTFTAQAVAAQAAILAGVTAEAIARRDKVTGSGVMLISDTWNTKTAYLDLHNMVIQTPQGYAKPAVLIGGPAEGTDGGGSGTGIRASVQVRGYNDDSAGTVVADPDNPGTLKWGTPKTAIGVVIQHVYGAASHFDVNAYRCALGCLLHGNSEKLVLDLMINDCTLGIMDTKTPITIASISQSNPAVITTDREHFYWTGLSQLEILNAQGMTQINGTTGEDPYRGYRVTRIDAFSFSIERNLGTNANPDWQPVNSTNFAAYTGGGVVLINSGSPDTNKIRLSGQRMFQVLRAGGDGTAYYDLNVEARYDPGTNIKASYNPLIQIPLPAIEVKSGKSCSIGGEIRAHNGRLYIYVDRDGTGNGTDGFFLRDLRYQDNVYGCGFMVDRIQRLDGYISGRKVHNGRYNFQETGADGEGKYDCAFVQLNEVNIGAGEFGFSIQDVGNREGVRFGDAVKGLSSNGVVFGRMSITMRGLDRKNGIYPTGRNAVVIEFHSNCSYFFNDLHGNIVIMANCLGNRISVDADWVKSNYNLTRDPSSTAHLFIRGSITSAQLFNKSWVQPGLRITVESLSDYGGVTAVYQDGIWTVEGYPLTSSAAQIASISSPVNGKFKRAGLIVPDRTNGFRTMVATGNAPTDPWVRTSDGTGPIIPGFSTATEALITRMTVAPSVAIKLLYDQVISGLLDLGLQDKLDLFYIHGGHDAQAARLNFFNAAYDLVAYNSPTWEQYKGFIGKQSRGATDDPATYPYLESGLNPSAGGTRHALNSGHVGAFTLTAGGSASGADIGSRNGKLSTKCGAGGTNTTRVSTSSNVGFTSPDAVPRHTLGNRVVSTAHTAWVNGKLIGTAGASNGVANQIDLLRSDIDAAHETKDYSSATVFASHVGAGLTEQEIAAISGLIRGFAQAVGAA